VPAVRVRCKGPGINQLPHSLLSCSIPELESNCPILQIHCLGQEIYADCCLHTNTRATKRKRGIVIGHPLSVSSRLISYTYLVSLLKGIIHEACDDAGLAYTLIAQEDCSHVYIVV